MVHESAYKIFFLAQFIYLISISKIFVRYFSNINHGGLVFQGFLSNLLSKGCLRFIYATWVCALIISYFYSGGIAFTFSLICLAFSRYFFISLRYSSVGRGNGAPGFMSYWLIFYAVIFQFLEFRNISSGAVINLMKWDFALIMLSASYYKYRTGYLRGRGIEFGLKNEMWSWAHQVFAKFSNNHVLFRCLNFFSIFVELLISIFLFLPGFDKIAAALLGLMFLLLLIFVRLGSLPITMLAFSYVLFASDTDKQNFTSSIFLEIFCLFYGLLLVFGSTWNWIFYLKLKTPKSVEIVLKSSYRITGSIIWSVFTARLTENLIKVYEVRETSRIELKPIDYGVHSGISLTTIATYTDYFPGESAEQERRVKIYLNSIHGKVSNLEIHFYKNKVDGDRLQSQLIKTFHFGSK